MTDDLSRLDATAQAELVRSGEASPRELVDAAIERIEALDPQLNAVVHPRFDRAREEADGDLPAGPFQGVPFLLKDLDGTSAGDPFHGGTRFLRDHDHIADHDSWLTERFRAAGLVVLGRTNTPELGLIPSTEPQTAGPTHNPWDLSRTAGGSSGGSAAAVAAGLVPAAHAGDGGGSIRIPAAFCGLVGLKPSRGRSSFAPDAGEAWGGFVQRLAVTRSVRDAAALLDAVAGSAPGDPYTAPPPARPYVEELGADPGRLRIGWRTASGVEDIVTEPEVADGVARTAALLEELGHRVEQASPPALDEAALTDNFVICFASFVARTLDELGELVGETPTAEGFETGTWAIAELGRSITAAQYLAARDALHSWSRRMSGWWAGGYDLLLTPTVPELPPVLGQFASTPDNPLQGIARSTPIVAFTAPFNVTGQPAVSLPMHRASGGLPVGVQLVAADHREDVLIRVSAQLEAASPWKDRVPAVHA